MRVVFMGTPEFAVPVLEELIKHYEVVLVVSQPDKEVGRKKELTSPPVKKCALSHNIKVFQPVKIRKEYEEVLAAQPDLIVTCAFGQMIPDIILNYPKYGAINVHASLLPKYRGGAPIQKSIMAGDDKTGISIMYMVKKMDAGDIILQESVKILDTDNLKNVQDKLSELGKDLLIKGINLILENKVERIIQDESQVTYAYNITREEEKIDWNRSAKEIFNHIRALNPQPLAYTILNDIDIQILEVIITDKPSTKEAGTIEEITKGNVYVSTKDKLILINKIKYPGKKEMGIKDFMNGIGKSVFKIGEMFK